MSFIASLKEKFQNLKTEFKRSYEEARRKEEERRRAAQQEKRIPHDNCKESHPQPQITDMNKNQFSLSSVPDQSQPNNKFDNPAISRKLVVDPTYTPETQIPKEGTIKKVPKLKSVPIFNESDLNSLIENESYRKYKSKYKNITAIRECCVDERVSAPWNFHIIATVERNISEERRTLSIRKIDFNNYRDLFLTGFCFLHETERTFKLDSADNEHIIYNNELCEPWQFFYKVKKIIQDAKEQSVSENITSK